MTAPRPLPILLISVMAPLLRVVRLTADELIAPATTTDAPFVKLKARADEALTVRAEVLFI